MSMFSKRIDQSYESRDSGGSNNGYMDWAKGREGLEVKFFKPKEKSNIINIIPYRIATKHHPMVRAGSAKVGDFDYVLDIWVHRNVGPDGVDVICPKKNYGKACPICAQAQEFKNEGKKDEASDLRPSRRVVYNVIDVNNPDEGIQVFDTSHFLFEKELVEASREDGEGQTIDFADPKEGRSVKFRGSMTSLGGNEFMEFKSFSFPERDPVNPKMMDKTHQLDAMMKVMSNEDISAVLFGDGDDDEDDEDDEDSAPVRGHAKDDDEDEPAPRSRHREEADDDDPPARASRSKAQDDDEDEPAAPKHSKAHKAQDDDDDEPAAKCPVKGGAYGKDADKYDECEGCKLWGKCAQGGK
jgi:hypothetical protein